MADGAGSTQDLDGNLSSRFQEERRPRSLAKKTEKPTCFADEQKTIADMEKTIAAQMDEIAKMDESAKQNVWVMEEHEQKIDELCSEIDELRQTDREREQTDREREQTVRSQAYKKGYAVGRTEPIRTNAKWEGAEEALEKAHKKMGKMEMTMEALTENAENDQVQLEGMAAKNKKLQDDLRFFSPLHDGAWFQLVPKHAPLFCVEVENGAKNDGAGINIWTKDDVGGGGSVFRFLPSPTAEGFYYLEARSVMDLEV